ncbi:MAG: hypothetical protein RLZZ326_1837 [Planctomycetota bacterium]
MDNHLVDQSLLFNEAIKFAREPVERFDRGREIIGKAIDQALESFDVDRLLGTVHRNSRESVAFSQSIAP